MSCKIKYKGKEYTEEELMIVLSQDSSIVDAYRPKEQRGAIGSEQRESMNKFQAKIDALKESMDVEVIIDENVKTSRVLAKSDPRTVRAGKPVILINPNAIFETTAIHEFAHIFVDSFPDGLQNKRLQKALKELEGTELYNQVKELYPDLSEEMFQKELITTAIGIKGSEIWDNKESASRFETFKKWFFDYLKRLFGLEQSQVESLTKDLIAGRVTNDITDNLSDYVQEERLADIVGEENIDDIESAVDITYQEMLARVTNLYDLYEPKSKIERAKERNKKKAGKRTAFQSVQELEEALRKYSEADQIRGFAKYISWAGKETKKLGFRIEKEKEEGSLDPNSIIRMKEFSAAFDILRDIQGLIVSAGRRNEITEAQQKRFLASVSDILKEKDAYEVDLLDASKQHYARVMAFNDVRHQEKRKSDFAKSWEDTQPDISKEEYVQQMMVKFKDDIIEESYQKYLARAEKSITDISSGVAMLASEKQMKSDEIQVASKLIDGKELATAKFASSQAGEMDKMAKEYASDISSSANQAKKYDSMLDETSNGRYFLAGEYQAEFIIERNKMQSEASDPDIYMEKYADSKYYTNNTYSLDGGATKKKIVIKGAKEIKVGKVHTTYKIGKEEYTIPSEEAIARSEYHYWNKVNTRRIQTDEGWRTVPSIGLKGTKDWRNANFDKLTDNEKKHLNFLKEKIKLADDLTSGTESLIKYGASQEFMEIPKVRKSTMSRINEGQSKGIITDMWENMTQVQQDEFDTQTSEGDRGLKHSVRVFADVSNKEKLRVPIPFRNTLEKKDQSLDLHSIVLMNLVQAKNYEVKKQVENLLLVMTDVMNNRYVPQTQGIQNLTKIHASSKEGDEKVLNNPKDKMPNDVKKMYDMIENRVYNIKNKTAGEVAGMDIQKLTSSWLRYSGMVSLVGNFANSIVNWNVGTLNNVLEAVGGEQYGLNDLSYATKQYWKDMKLIVNDWGSNVDASRTNLFMNILNVMGDKNYLDNNFEENNRVKALFKTNSLRPIAKAGEHMMQAQVMYAMMRSIRITNEKGQYLNANGNVVTSKKGAASINEVIEFTKNDDGSIEMVLPEWVKANTFSGSASHNQMLLDVRNAIKKKVMDLHGNYDSDVQAAAQREFWGKLLFFLRKWIEPGYFRRWRGLENIMKKDKDLREVDKYFSTDLKMYQEGYYVTAVRFLTHVLPKAVKEMSFEQIKEYKDGLLPHEKANIRKILTELGMISMIFLSYLALGGDDDDENLYARYLLRRQYSEMTFFMLPGEAYKIASTPTASMGMAKRIIQIFGQGMSPTERYKQGKNKGELKLKVKTMKMIPIYAQTKKDLEESLRFLNSVN